MAVRGFCEHGKVWTTCAICGKDIIANQSGKKQDLDEWGDLRPKKKPVKTIPDEPPEDAGASEDDSS